MERREEALQVGPEQLHQRLEDYLRGRKNFIITAGNLLEIGELFKRLHKKLGKKSVQLELHVGNTAINNAQYVATENDPTPCPEYIQFYGFSLSVFDNHHRNRVVAAGFTSPLHVSDANENRFSRFPDRFVYGKNEGPLAPFPLIVILQDPPLGVKEKLPAFKRISLDLPTSYVGSCLPHAEEISDTHLKDVLAREEHKLAEGREFLQSGILQQMRPRIHREIESLVMFPWS